MPVPYPVVDFCGHDQNYTPSVRFTGEKAMVMRSNTSHVHGDEPGTGLGIKSGTVGGISEPITHAAQVRAEGSHVIRHLDRFKMNNGNTVGEAIFVRDTKTYAAPKDDDPLTGSMAAQAMPFERYQVAQAATGTMTDAGVAPQAGANVRAGTAGRSIPVPTQKAPPVPLPRLLLRRLGIYGLIIEEEMRRAGMTPTARQQEDLARGIAGSTADRVVTRQDKLLGGQQHFANPFRVLYPSTWKGKYGVFAGPADHVPMANDILSRLAGRPVNMGEMTLEQIDGILSPFTGLSEKEIEAKLAETNAEPAPGPRNEPPPRPIPPLIHGVRVDENKRRPRCRFERICFMPVSNTVDRNEFRRQLKLQETALNRMTPSSMLRNRGAYLANPVGMRALSEPLQATTRAEYRQSRMSDFRRLYGPRWEAELAAHMTAVAALHNPDMIAGGAYTSVADRSIPLPDRIGGLNENSSMGSQWRGGRSQKLTNHAAEEWLPFDASRPRNLRRPRSLRGTADAGIHR